MIGVGGAAVWTFFGLEITTLRSGLVMDEVTSDSGTTIVVFDFGLKRSVNPVLAPGMSELLT